MSRLHLHFIRGVTVSCEYWYVWRQYYDVENLPIKVLWTVEFSHGNQNYDHLKGPTLLNWTLKEIKEWGHLIDHGYLDPLDDFEAFFKTMRDGDYFDVKKNLMDWLSVMYVSSNYTYLKLLIIIVCVLYKEISAYERD